jgi:hypothetical protein
MQTALIIAATVTVLVTAMGLLVVLTGWFPRLAALAARGIDVLPLQTETRLDPREWSELRARLWVPL